MKAIQQLKDKLEFVINEMKNTNEELKMTPYHKGYIDGLINISDTLTNISKDIDAQMLVIERERHCRTWDAAIKAGSIFDFNKYEIK